MTQLVKNPPAMQETWVPSLGWEDPLEKGKATHSVFWPGEFHGPYSPWGHKEWDMTEQLSLTSLYFKDLAIYSRTLGVRMLYSDKTTFSSTSVG